MAYYDSGYGKSPTGLSKIFFFHWPLFLLILAVSATGFMMLYSVAGGSFDPWARAQMIRFSIGIVGMFIIAFVHIRFWRRVAPVAYVVSLILLIVVYFFGDTGMGAQRWIDLGFIQLQPSEVMKISLIMALAMYYDWLEPENISRPLWVLLPVLLTLVPMGLVLIQPDLGTAILLALGAGVVMFLAGVSLWYFGTALAAGIGLITAVMMSRGTDWQILKNYQYSRIETFLDPSIDPLGSGYHITQSKIALGSGGFSGRGFMQGTQSRLNFLPEKHTDFIFTTLAEEFGFIGSISLLVVYAAIVGFVILSAISNRDRFAGLLTGGLGATFFFFFAVNMAMVMGVVPVVGVPLPLVSYGGTAMLVLLGGFGLIQSAHIHRPR
ncbi:MAG: rod shape-determining protein RodA [Alphaproteobacteria bacterium]